MLLLIFISTMVEHTKISCFTAAARTGAASENEIRKYAHQTNNGKIIPYSNKCICCALCALAGWLC